MKLISNCIHIYISKIDFVASIKLFNNYSNFYSHRKTLMSTNKGKQPIESKKVSGLTHEKPPFPIPFPSFYPPPSAASQILIDNIWSTYLSGQCNFLMQKHLSDLANHLKYLEAKIQMLEQHAHHHLSLQLNTELNSWKRFIPFFRTIQLQELEMKLYLVR